MDPKDWMVCRISVADVEKLGLQVVHLPTERDPGHCEIRGTQTQRLAGKVISKLAKKTRVLTSGEVETLQAGDSLIE